MPFLCIVAVIDHYGELPRGEMVLVLASNEGSDVIRYIPYHSSFTVDTELKEMAVEGRTFDSVKFSLQPQNGALSYFDNNVTIFEDLVSVGSDSDVKTQVGKDEYYDGYGAFRPDGAQCR
jgi:hypothetical protein